MSLTVSNSDLASSPAPRNDLATRARRHAPALVGVGLFLAFGALVLSHSSSLLEPDDYAYRASIVALSHGHLLLTNAQYHALARSLSGGIAQWHHLASGLWISEKNPGYPFLAVPFYWLGLLRVAPLFYGALACGGLYLGARAWLGRWGGTAAVALYLFSGTALTFAWRATMPSFTDASLVAAGAGLLIWALWSSGASPARRGWAATGALIALELATFVRYTDVVLLIVGALALVLLARPARFPARQLLAPLASLVLSGAGILAFNAWAYGSATSTGYSAGEITFSTSAIGSNLLSMPAQWTRSMPLWILATLVLLALYARAAWPSLAREGSSRSDLVTGLAIGAGWWALWALYLAYTWTVQAGGGPSGAAVTVHLVRFYLPGLGPMALLGAWAVVRTGRVLRLALLAGALISALASFSAMAAAGPAGASGPGGGAPALHGQAPSAPPSGGGSGAP